MYTYILDTKKFTKSISFLNINHYMTYLHPQNNFSALLSVNFTPGYSQICSSIPININGK